MPTLDFRCASCGDTIDAASIQIAVQAGIERVIRCRCGQTAFTVQRDRDTGIPVISAGEGPIQDIHLGKQRVEKNPYGTDTPPLTESPGSRDSLMKACPICRSPVAVVYHAYPEARLPDEVSYQCHPDWYYIVDHLISGEARPRCPRAAQVVDELRSQAGESR